MRKFHFILLVSIGAFLSLASCDKNPNFDKMDDDYIVRTDYDKQFDFGSKVTYFLSDTVYVIDGSSKFKMDKWEYNTNKNAEAILDVINYQMKAVGYEPTKDTAKADMTFFVTYFNDVQAYYNNYNNWWDYWSAWGGWYWGYYPAYPSYYAPVYTYQLGSIEIDIIDQKATPKMVKQGYNTKPIVWSTYATGLNSGSNAYDRTLVVNAINQAFAQSPYLTPKK